MDSPLPSGTVPEQFSANLPARDMRTPAQRANPFRSCDIERILRSRGWLAGEACPDVTQWMHEAASLLGPQATEISTEPSEISGALENLLFLIFVYDAKAILSSPENQAVMSREGAREVIRELANRILSGPEIDSTRFKEIIDGMKARLSFHARKLFHPIRLALVGRAGEGELDRVILLLDSASQLTFATAVKGTRQRIIEFCAALD